MRKQLWYIVGGVSVSTLLVSLVSGGLFAAPVLTLPKQIRPAPACFDTANRYIDCGNGTVTGLIWLENANCLLGTRNYQLANEFAAELADGQCGLTDGSSAGDWRLPMLTEWTRTIAQAVTLVCTGANAPTLTNAAGTGCHSASPVFSGVQTASIGRLRRSPPARTSRSPSACSSASPASSPRPAPPSCGPSAVAVRPFDPSGGAGGCPPCCPLAVADKPLSDQFASLELPKSPPLGRRFERSGSAELGRGPAAGPERERP